MSRLAMTVCELESAQREETLAKACEERSCFPQHCTKMEACPHPGKCVRMYNKVVLTTLVEPGTCTAASRRQRGLLVPLTDG
mmetsp:Transcript_22986/g.64586  ORF Transcript_22986/g.64586 Transcript_22986/m.64586 type:complete len:82 (-) Transcript_22986:1315-1560(-)